MSGSSLSGPRRVFFGVVGPGALAASGCCSSLLIGWIFLHLARYSWLKVGCWRSGVSIALSYLPLWPSSCSFALDESRPSLSVGVSGAELLGMQLDLSSSVVLVKE